MYYRIGGAIGSGGGGGGGTVTAVTASSPLHSSGGSTPNITIQQANSTQAGFLSAADWNTFNNKLDPSAIVKTPNTFAGFDVTGALETIPGWAISTDTGGAAALLNLTPADTSGGQTNIINNFQNTVTPTVDLVNLGFYNMQNYLYLLGPVAMNNTTGFRNGVETQDIGDKGNITALDQSIFLGDGTNASSSENIVIQNHTLNINNNQTVNQGLTSFNSAINVETGSSVNYINSINQFVTIDGMVNNNVNLINMGVNANIALAGGSGISGINQSSNIHDVVQFLNGYGSNWNLHAGANVTNGVNAFTDSLNQASGSTTHGVVSFAAFCNFDLGSTLANGYTGVTINPVINGDMSGNGYNGFNSNPQYSGTMNYSNGFGVFQNFNSGSNVVNGVSAFNDNTNVQSGASVNFYTSMGLFPNIQSGSTLNDFQGININPQIVPNVSGSIQMLQINGFGGSTTPNLTGINVNLSQLNSTSLKQGLTINDGAIQVQANYDTSILPASPGFIGINSIGGLFHVAAGSPVTNTLAFANTVGMSTVFEDDYGPDPFVGNLCFANVNHTSQLIVTNTKTITAYNQMLLAVSLPSGSSLSPPITDGGTITEAFSLRMPGFLPQGGSLSITNMYQIYMDAIGGSSAATNAWGLYIADPALQNYFKSSIAIDTTSTKVSNGSVGLEIGSTTKALRLSNLTSTERDALTALAGMEIFNTTSNQVEFYNGSSWTSGGSGSLTEALEYHTVTAPEAAAKQFTLINTPSVAANVMCDIITGGPQAFSVDFTITTNVFDWNTLGLDGILDTGDIVRLHYLY